MLVRNGRHFNGAPRQGAREARIGIIDDHDHANRARTARGRRTIRIFLDPERRAIDQQLRDDDLTRIAIELVRDHGAERTRVEVESLTAIGYREPRGNPRFDSGLAHQLAWRTVHGRVQFGFGANVRDG
jgi:hypothetical protein